MTRKIDPLGHASLTDWDFSCKVAETDPLGRTTAYEYSPYGELTGFTSPAGDSTVYDYNEYGQLTQVTQPDGANWRLHYSEQGNLTGVIDPQGRVEETRYGPQGEILRQVLPDGRAWRYGYEQQQLSEIQAPDAPGPGLTSTAWAGCCGSPTPCISRRTITTARFMPARRAASARFAYRTACGRRLITTASAGSRR